MGNRVAFSNIDIEVMKTKLSKLDDVSERIKTLSSLLDNKELSNIKPEDFYSISESVSKAYKGVDGSPYTAAAVQKTVTNARVSAGLGDFTKIKTKFSNDAVTTIAGIKAIRDNIEWANRSREAGESGETTQEQAYTDTSSSVTDVTVATGDKNKYYLPQDVSLTLPNGEKIVLGAGEHDIVDKKYDKNGKLEAIAIMQNGKKVWIYFDKNGKIQKYVVETNGVTYNVASALTLKLPNGSEVIIPAGTYQVLECVFNTAGQLTQMTLLVDGRKITVEVKDGEIVGGISVDDYEYEVKKDISLTLPNGKKLNIKAGKYKVLSVEYDAKGNVSAVCIEIDGYKVWLYLDEKGNISKIVIKIENEEYTLSESVTYEVNGEKIVITPGNYKLLELIYDASGNLIQIIILVDGKRVALDVKNGKVIGIVDVQNSEYEFKGNLTLKLPNGTELHITPGKYKLLDILYDANGNVSAVCIEVDGHKVWIYYDEKGNITKVVVISNNGKFVLDEDYEYTDASGKKITIEKGKYPLLEAIYDASGNLIQVVILVDGKRVTIDIRNGKVVGVTNVEPATITIKNTLYAYASDGTLVEITPGVYKILRYLYDKDGNIIAVVIEVGGKIVTLRYFNGNVVGIKIKPTVFDLKETVKVTLPDGTVLEIKPGSYEIIDAIFDANGNITAVCISHNGMKFWLYLDSNGRVIKVEYITVTPGVFNITSPDLTVKDKFGNILPNIDPGQYYIYEVRYDANGNIIAVRISPDGEDEVWVYLNPDSKNDTLSFFDKNVEANGGILSLFKKNGSLLGILGVLFVAAGVTMALKKRKKKQENEEYSDEYIDQDDSSEWERGESISSGNYAVYDVEEKDGKVTAARITPDDAEEEYWVEM